MSLLVTGSIGIDTVEAPWGKVEDALGGSSIYFAYAAGFLTPVRLVGAVGEDCPPGFLKPVQDNPNIDMAGLEVRAGSKTFRWHGRYQADVNLRDTVEVELNVLAEPPPAIPAAFRDSRFVFLANTHPALQAGLLDQLDGPALVVADTMDLWIAEQGDALRKLLTRIDGLVLNDSEARQLSGQANVVLAGRQIAETVGRDGGGFVIVKKGEHGCLLFADGSVAALPAWPSQHVVDPTGAGDSFAGGLMGHLASCGRLPAGAGRPGELRRAIACGTVIASFTLEDFSLRRLQSITRADIDARLAEYEAMLRI